MEHAFPDQPHYTGQPNYSTFIGTLSWFSLDFNIATHYKFLHPCCTRLLVLSLSSAPPVPGSAAFSDFVRD